MLRAPTPDPGLDPFRGGVAVLSRDGQVAGHLASTVTTFWSPNRPLSRQWWVWMIVVWADGVRERSFEDYPPWTAVREIQAGTLEWERGDHQGVYAVRWVPDDERQAILDALGIGPKDF